MLKRRFRQPEIDIDKIRPIAGLGANALLKLGFNIDENHPQHQQMRQDYLDAYAICCEKRLPQLFENVDRLLRALDVHNLVWGIVTNKHQRFVDKLLPKFSFTIPPKVVVCGDTLSVSKPNPQPLLYAAEKLNLKACECIYVGDSKTDILAGKSAGMKTVLAEWGYIENLAEAKTWGADFTAPAVNQLLASIGFTN